MVVMSTVIIVIVVAAGWHTDRQEKGCKVEWRIASWCNSIEHINLSNTVFENGDAGQQQPRVLVSLREKRKQNASYLQNGDSLLDTKDRIEGQRRSYAPFMSKEY